MIKRNEAVQFLDALMASGMFSGEVNTALNDIIGCIQAEEDNLHIWGVDDEDVEDLYSTPKEEYMTDEYKVHIDELYGKYSFTPSIYEQKQFDAELKEMENINEGNGDTAHESDC